MEGDLVVALRRGAIDVVAPAEAALMGAQDDAHMAFASGSGRVLYTFNAVDFCRIHTEWLMRTVRTRESSSAASNGIR